MRARHGCEPVPATGRPGATGGGWDGSLTDLQGFDHVDIFLGITDAAAAALAIAVVISVTRRQRASAENPPLRRPTGPLVPEGPHTYSVEPAWERVEVDRSAPAQLPTGFAPAAAPPEPETPLEAAGGPEHPELPGGAMGHRRAGHVPLAVAAAAGPERDVRDRRLPALGAVRGVGDRGRVAVGRRGRA